MQTKITLFSMIIAIFALLFSCDEKVYGSLDSGLPIGTTESGVTVGKSRDTFCKELGEAYCEAFTRCYPNEVMSKKCFPAFLGMCCSNRDTCGDPVSVDDAAFEQCKGDMVNMECAHVDILRFPASCEGVY